MHSGYTFVLSVCQYSMSHCISSKDVDQTPSFIKIILDLLSFGYLDYQWFSKIASYGFGMTSGWVNANRLFNYWWTVPLNVNCDLYRCEITSREYCNFMKGYFHEEATLCSQVSEHCTCWHISTDLFMWSSSAMLWIASRGCKDLQLYQCL